MNMKIRCPLCKRIMAAEQVNMSTDLALCSACNQGFKISENIDSDLINPETLSHPPAGAWFRRELDRTVVGASTRSPNAFFLVPFTCVWSGFSLSGIYGRQILSGEFDLVSSLFGIPFVFGSVMLGAATLMMVCGKVEVSIGRGSSVFTGIGHFGRRRTFDWAAIRSVRDERADGSNSAIVLEGKELIKFGSGLNEQRRHFAVTALKYLRAETLRV